MKRLIDILLIAITCALVTVSCGKAQEPQRISPATASATQKEVPKPKEAAKSAAPKTIANDAPAPAAKTKGAQVIKAKLDGQALEELVAQELKRAKQDERDLVVYVGAKWCEPCVRFHRAVKRGAVDKELPTLRLLEFDRDRDAARLAGAGYGSRMIPLFVLPNTDGRASDRRIEGSVKGPGATANIVPRLKELLAAGTDQ